MIRPCEQAPNYPNKRPCLEASEQEVKANQFAILPLELVEEIIDINYNVDGCFFLQNLF